MTFWKKIVERFFKKQTIDAAPGHNTRFDISVTPGQVADVISAVLKQKKIKYNPKMQHRKNKTQRKNWAKWRV